LQISLINFRPWGTLSRFSSHRFKRKWAQIRDELSGRNISRIMTYFAFCLRLFTNIWCIQILR